VNVKNALGIVDFLVPPAQTNGIILEKSLSRLPIKASNGKA